MLHELDDTSYVIKDILYFQQVNHCFHETSAGL